MINKNFKLNIIETPAMTGTENMNYDLKLLDNYINNNTEPFLRFYIWNPPTLSLGRSQNINEINIDKCEKYGIDIIKRPTGGKAVLHQGELTYSFTAGKKHGLPDNIFDSYIEISKALIKGLEYFSNKYKFLIGDKPVKDYTNNSFCFSTSIVTDINYEGRKLVGSAQIRKGENFLQHGSILINQDFSILKELFNSEIETYNLINLSEIIESVDSEKLKKCIVEGFKNHFSVDTIIQ